MKIKKSKLLLRLKGVTIKEGVEIEGPGKLKIGTGSIIYKNSQLVCAKNAELNIGERCSIGRFNRITCLKSLTIGNDVLIAQCVSIMDSKHKTELNGIPYKLQGYDLMPTRIGNNVWIGANAVILHGVTIGDNSIIGANSVVNKNVKPNSVYAGSPAKFIKKVSDIH